MPTNQTETQLGQKPTASELFPDFSRNSVILTFVSAVLLLVITLSAARAPWHPEPLKGLLGLATAYALISALWFCSLRRLSSHWGRAGMRASYVLAWLTLMAITALVTAITHAALPTELAHFYIPVAPFMLMAAIIGIISLRYFYIYSNWQRFRRIGRIARSQALSARIRPHFLFNTLNTIAELTRADPEAAEHAVEDLARLYRMSLANAESQVTLADEINTAKSYLYIEQYRIGARLQQAWDTDQLPADAQLPILTLQPLVENAIYHGIEQSLEGGKLSIEGWVEGEQLFIVVTNPVTDNERSNKQKGNNMAVENIRQRLIMAFGKQASMTTQKINDEYQVTLRFPYVTQDTQG